MIGRVWSFCKICEKYHVNWDKGNLDKNFETHLTPEEKLEAYSFGIYKKEVPNLKGVLMIFADPEAMPLILKSTAYMSGFFEPKQQILP